MLKLGYKLMSEEHGPTDLIRNAVAAKAAGFDFAAISDHFFPWLEAQGHAPFVWSVLGAIAQAAPGLDLMTAVTCPTMRYHPAVIAQAAATMALMTNDRFTLGLGSGERLNEHIVGAGWPGVAERLERFAEAVHIIQGLLKGDLSNYRGRYLQIDDARLFDRPQKKPPVIIAAGGPQAAALAGEKGDGLIATEPRKDIVDAFVTAGGGRAPRYAEVAMCYDAREETAASIAHEHFRWALTGWPVQAELPNPKGFEAASRHITREAVAGKITCGPSVRKHLDAITSFVDAGFTHLILVQIGPNQTGFLKMFADELAPALRGLSQHS